MVRVAPFTVWRYQGRARMKEQAYKRVQRREQISDPAQNLRVEDLSVGQLGADCKASEA
jgi:hypothetical protein